MRKVAAAFALFLLGTSVLAQRPSDPALLDPGDGAATGLRGRAGRGDAARRDHDGRDGERRLRRQRPPVRSHARRHGVLRVRSERRLRPLVRRRAVHPLARPAHRPRRQPVGHRRRRAHRREVQSRRPGAADAGHEGRGRRVERGGGLAQAESAQRCRHRATTATSSSCRDTRQDRAATPACSSSTRPAGSSSRGAARARARVSSRSRTASPSMPRGCCGSTDRENQRIQMFDADGHVRQGDEVRRTAVQRRYRPPVHLHGQRLRRPGGAAGPERQGARGGWDGRARARANSARRTSSPSARRTSCTSPTRSTARS